MVLALHLLMNRRKAWPCPRGVAETGIDTRDSVLILGDLDRVSIISHQW